MMQTNKHKAIKRTLRDAGIKAKAPLIATLYATVEMAGNTRDNFLSACSKLGLADAKDLWAEYKLNLAEVSI
jgi:hypothetical protein